jgi:type III secretory pathway component EscS
MDSKLKRINISDIGNLAEAVSAIGVVVSLIYLALQIQQNTNAFRQIRYYT